MHGAFLVQKFLVYRPLFSDMFARLIFRKKKQRKEKSMDISTIGTVVSIVVITYLIGLAAKRCEKISDESIPVIVGLAGGILGVVGMFVIPDFPAHDVMNAAAVGIVSGLASTGIDQVYKQTKKKG